MKDNTFQYEPMFPVGADATEYRVLSSNYVSSGEFEGNRIIRLEREGLVLLAETAFSEIANRGRSAHWAQTAAILNAPQSSADDRYVALEIGRTLRII